MASHDQLTPGGASAPAVLAQTPEWLALFKPAGWLTIPGRSRIGGASGAGQVLSEWAATHHGPIWVVHRLDRETSGIVLMARTAEAHRKAGLWFQRHEVRKTYDFLAQGTLRAPTVRVQQPIEGAPSLTQLELKESFEGCFLGRAFPHSGRRHQIRIHLASSEGCPILGDAAYGGPGETPLPGGRAPLSVPRVALHAARLELPSGERFEASWPDDFAGWVKQLREARAIGGTS